MANEVLKNLGFHHIALKCNDLEKSLSMYKALGMTEIVRWGADDGTIVMLDIGDGGRIELFANGSDEYSAKSKWAHFAMYTDDVDAAYTKALSVGFSSLTPPKTVPLDSSPEKIAIHIAFVTGPDGEEIEFFKQI